MHFSAAWIGHRVFLPPQPAKLRVSGATSRGIFLFSAFEQVIFLSFEPYRGPLTLNLNINTLSAASGETVLLEADRFLFPSGAIVDLNSAREWLPPPPPEKYTQLEQRTSLLHAVALEILSTRPQAGLAPLLGRLFDLPFPMLGSDLRGVEDALHALRQGEPVVASIRPILGLGRGLTPSGDDFTTGLLLARARSGSPVHQEELSNLSAFARSRTTSLSAALIESAGLGSADERLLQACDALVTGNRAPGEIFSLLAAYGSSSGIDAFAGMAAYWMLK